MTHKDIYTKFMIEYDKANVTSSYPSLTEYEVATFLDKAYNALIAQKVTGNNTRRAPFEADTKAISDLQGLVTTRQLSGASSIVPADNVLSYDLPEDFLYCISAKSADTMIGVGRARIPRYNRNVKLVTHAIAEKFFATATNMPWIKEPVAYIENNTFYYIYDNVKIDSDDDLVAADTPAAVGMTYIKTPNKFAKNLDEIDGAVSYFDWDPEFEDGETPVEYEFELNDTAAEELVNLAITFALENVESQRLNTKLNTRGLEA